jgi:MFS-type transporter involved in bile tolerance (Atg22 family)
MSDKLSDEEINKKELSNTEILLTSGKIYSVIGLVSYILLIFITGIIGFGLLKGAKIPFTNRKIKPKRLKFIASVLLIFIWCLLIIVESVKLTYDIY